MAGKTAGGSTATHLDSLIPTTACWNPVTEPLGIQKEKKRKKMVLFLFLGFSPKRRRSLCFRFEVTTAAQVDPSLLPGELIIPPPRRASAHVEISRVLQRSPPLWRWRRSLRTPGEAQQGDANCPLMRLFGAAGRGPAGQGDSRCF